MKMPNKSTRGSRFGPHLVRTMSFGIALCGMLPHAEAESVDSEIVLLVDITRPGLSQPQFNRLLDGYATAFTSSEVLDSIQSGSFGRIAISMMMYGNASTQIIGVPWMTIGNATQAQQFADLVRNVNRPFTIANGNIAEALTAATLSFGTETGGVDNGYDSAVQIVEVATSDVPNNFTAPAVSASSDNALAAGVDLINSLALGNRANAIDAFFTANVIGSTIDGVAPSGTTSSLNGTLASTMSGMFTETVQTGATASINAVPEPGTAFGLIPATFFLLRRRRR